MIRRITFIFICLHVAILSFAQTGVSVNKDTANVAAQFLKNWQNNLFDGGFKMENDSLHLNDEAKKLLLDSQYRRSTYPVTYTWPGAIQLLKQMDLKQAFWHLINLYKTDTSHKELALQTFVVYDSLVDMEKILINTFYTYALTDPEVCVFKNGKPEILHPDILEAKFNKMKEIINYIVYYRSTKAIAKKP
jgi:hypothetical protein